MSDTQYKRGPRRHQFHPASSLALSSPSELKRPQAEAMARSQDSVLAGYRMLFHRNMGGSKEWFVNNVATGGVTQSKPDQTTWRRVSLARVEQQAGTSLIVRVFFVPSGATERQDLANWVNDGVGGSTRVLIEWDTVNGDHAEATVEFNLDGESDPDGAEPVQDGAQWGQLQWKAAAIVAPPNIANNLVVGAKYSEHVTVTIANEDRGGARVIMLTVSEQPADHTAEHDDPDVIVTGSLDAWETNRPQVAAPDGATFEEPRYGIHRSMDVAARQTERLGPIHAQWSCYAETRMVLGELEPPPVTTTSATYVRMGPGQNTVWDTNAVGWPIIGTKRMPEHATTRIAGACSNPVRIRVWCRFAAAGVAKAKIKVQSTNRSWTEIELDQAVIGTTWQWVMWTAWLEARVASDDFWPVLQPFFRTDGVEQLEVRYFTVCYGEFPVGA